MKLQHFQNCLRLSKIAFIYFVGELLDLRMATGFMFQFILISWTFLKILERFLSVKKLIESQIVDFNIESLKLPFLDHRFSGFAVKNFSLSRRFALNGTWNMKKLLIRHKVPRSICRTKVDKLMFSHFLPSERWVV